MTGQRTAPVVSRLDERTRYITRLADSNAYIGTKLEDKTTVDAWLVLDTCLEDTVVIVPSQQTMDTWLAYYNV
jgi:hypothetical protein